MSNQEVRDEANEELKTVVDKLRDARKILRRDWEQLSTRERSAQTRIVKDLEQREQELIEILETHPPH
ncbi:MAG TPA: hypothetical protein VF681_04465 [Abditibacteriaceae bacterium]|jgi:hypothetical protein